MKGASTSWNGKRRWTRKFQAAALTVGRHTRCSVTAGVVMGRFLARACSGIIVGGLLLGPGAEAREQARSSPVSVERVPSAPHWMQGQVIVSAPPEVVWARLQDVAGWPKLLTDVARLEVKERRGSRWEIELETRTLGHGQLPYHVELEPGRRVRFWRSGSGVAVQAFLLVRDGPAPGKANVVYSLYVHLTGLPHLLLPDSSLDEKQEHMVSVTLGDLERGFRSP